MRPNIHILGIQGSGKGTQSALLVERFGLTYLASGNLLRERAAVPDSLGRQLAGELRAGRLLPHPLVVAVIEDYLGAHPIEVGLLGDGVIRTLVQHEALLPIWEHYRLDQPLLIHLQLDEDTARQRIIQRQREQHDPGKRDYHLRFSGKLLRRDDDNPAAIHERFALYHQLTEPVIRHFESIGRCLHIDARPPIPEVASAINTTLATVIPALVAHS